MIMAIMKKRAVSIYLTTPLRAFLDTIKYKKRDSQRSLQNKLLKNQTVNRLRIGTDNRRLSF